MKASQIYLKTYKENPANADSVNHTLLIRAGMIHQQGNGLFSFLPLGMKVLEKIKKIIREELAKANASEMVLPLLSSKKVWDRAGRWDSYGPEMMRLQDRKERSYALAPTAEVEFLNLIDKDINSYKDFPIVLYQISDKFRDEIRPRFGLLRARQFLMKDAYSFHSSKECLDKTFEDIKQAYVRIFNRLKLDFKICEADTGAIGGDGSFEFIVKTDAGEADILYCDCGFAANIEKASNFIESVECNNEECIEIKTPNAETMDQISSFLNKDKKDGLKSLLVKNNKEFFIVALRGDRTLNELKLSAIIGDFEYATDEEIKKLGLEKGYIGVKDSKIKIIADNEAIQGSKYCGANKKDMHLLNLNYGRDWTAFKIADIRNAVEGDICPECCKRELKKIKGIEVGHIFKIGTKYSEMMNANFIDRDGKEKNVIMASYGIGVSRVLATLVEQNSKDKIKWPEGIEPFEASIVVANTSNEEQNKIANDVYDFLKDNGIDVMLDDRTSSLGSKIKDSELIGIPKMIIVGNNIKSGNISILSKESEQNIPTKDINELLQYFN